MRSLSFKIRPPGTRQARFPGSLGGGARCRAYTWHRIPRRSPGQGPLSSPYSPSGRSVIRRATLITQRVPIHRWQLYWSRFFTRPPGSSACSLRFFHPRRNHDAPTSGDWSMKGRGHPRALACYIVCHKWGGCRQNLGADTCPSHGRRES